MAEARVLSLMLERTRRELRECLEYGVRCAMLNDTLQRRLTEAQQAHHATRSALETRIIALQEEVARLQRVIEDMQVGAGPCESRC
jgi:hypothetical protein